MKRLVFLIAFSLCFIGSVRAETVQVKDSHFFHSHIRNVTVHDKTIDTDTHKADDGREIGVGADVLIIESKHVDLVGEYRFDWENSDHTVYAVFKTKKSLVDYIKGFLGR